ncbi:1,2-phenylacetyl-CoA epoxidase subunit PaaC [Flaviaesturariibacter flavus]|uniref:1,2-phenylacetyl-CoA epoxidase subunit PaaC n=1 Tax=Flaviaesturariibacter flavus TaxID=2502780 RepID=UPI001FB3E067|nr:1,2-phenylacetyl-CoA epoxidase subunit PaaC [Flaviaesturariibacter flavus]
MAQQHFEYILHLADNALILGQRNAEWCGHGPVLEQDIAITNISLDLIGQARMLFQHAAEIYNAMDDAGKASVEKLLPRTWKTYGRELQEDDLAFLRDERQYRNLLLTELPKGDWAQTILRQFFFSAFQYAQYEALQQSGDSTLAAIAEKSLKEVTYHRRWSAEWVVRLGDGTEESRRRIEGALQELWPFTGEAFKAAGFEDGDFAPDPARFRAAWDERVAAVFAEATLAVPATGTWSQEGGKRGIHTEYMGYLLAEMQTLQRSYPNVTW